MLHFSKADFKRSLNTRKPFKNKLKTFLKERERQRETETERDRERQRQRDRRSYPKNLKKKLPKCTEEAIEMAAKYLHNKKMCF